MNEFEFIDSIKSKYLLNKVGDDCAVLPKNAENDLLVTADLLVEDIDFRLEWTTPEFLGHKALAVSLSDIAAMGGTPKWAMLSLGLPENLWKNSGFLNEFYLGWTTLANDLGVELIGGDVSRSTDKLVLDSIVGGEVAKGKAIFRSGAKPGDRIYVTGSLGGSAGGLNLLENGSRFDPTLTNGQCRLILKQLKPSPHRQTANWLRTLDNVSAMIDISDGISSDLLHVCLESRVGAKIYVDRLPIDQNLAAVFPSEACLDMALNGGEDFELLFTLTSQPTDAFPGTLIGEITPGPSEVLLVRDGKTEHLSPKGYRHF